MHERMPVFGLEMLVIFLMTLLLFSPDWRSPIFWLLFVGLGLVIADLVVTATFQFPINEYVQSVDTNRLSGEQTQKLATMHTRQLKNFRSREYFSFTSFLLVSLTPLC